jgi:hypothetical protein
MPGGKMLKKQENQCENATAQGHDKSCPYKVSWKNARQQI